MKSKNKNKSKSLGLAFYFGFAVLLIVLTSLVFKGIDLFRNSKFDGNHHLSVAVLDSDQTQILSVNPEEGTITRLDLDEKSSLQSLRSMSMPVDGYVDASGLDINNFSPKSEFFRIFTGVGKSTSDLSFIDLLRLSIYCVGVDQEKVDSQKIEISELNDPNISDLVFKDDSIVSEKVSIEISNTTDVAGLGNKLAKYITSLGGVVILVNTSPNSQRYSKIIYNEESYTTKKISKSLGIPLEKGRGSDLADVIIVIGEDKKNLFN